jgi:hypothetical protein
MIKGLYTLIILILLSACSDRDSENEIKLSTLIEADFTYTQDLFNCSLNQNQSLISLETFFSKNISKYKTLAEEESLGLSIFFPDNNSNITNFIISIISNKNPGGIKKFIDSINEDSFDKVATCSFAIYQNRGINFQEKSTKKTDLYTNVEILNCNFNDGYNFGTFEISINKFINNLRLIKLPYSMSYLEDNSSNDGFIWINYYYTDDYEKILLENWIGENNSMEIQNEFSENATCIESNKYKSYRLI